MKAAAVAWAQFGREAARAARRSVLRARDPRTRSWPVPKTSWDASCNICGWHGSAFIQPGHSEMGRCPFCDSIARDRFVYHCLTSRTEPRDTKRLLETSPRLGRQYRDVMHRRFTYLASDYELKAHEADIQIDLQEMDLPDGSLDAIITAHVLEHVPDYDRALAELYRVLRPGGVVYIHVPLFAAVTAPPPEPEYHADDTLVFWRFGFDLASFMRKAGFGVRVLVPQEFVRAVETNDRAWAEAHSGRQHDVVDMITNVDPNDLESVLDDRFAQRLGVFPSYMFVAFEGRRPG